MSKLLLEVRQLTPTWRACQGVIKGHSSIRIFFVTFGDATARRNSDITVSNFITNLTKFRVMKMRGSKQS